MLAAFLFLMNKPERKPQLQTPPAAPAAAVQYPFPDLVLKNADPEGVREYAFGTTIRKEDVTAITFLDSLETAPDKTQDVSETGNGKVLLWAEDDHLYIAGDGKVFFPADSRRLFGSRYDGSPYKNLKQINFGNTVDTSRVTDMGSMFHYCISLTNLDLSSFDTGNVTSVGSIFSGCPALISLDVSSFNTGNVTDMSWMFDDCRSLTSLDLSSFNTDNVPDMGSMFIWCSSDLKLITNDSRIRAQFAEDTQ